MGEDRDGDRPERQDLTLSEHLQAQASQAAVL